MIQDLSHNNELVAVAATAAAVAAVAVRLHPIAAATVALAAQ